MYEVKFNQDVHRIHDIPFTAHLRRELDDPDLFTYRHQDTGNWMVAVWNLPRDRGRKFLELANLGKQPVGRRGIVEDLREMRRETTIAKERRVRVRRHLQTDHTRYHQSILDDQAQENDYKRSLRRSLNHVKREHPSLRTDWN